MVYFGRAAVFSKSVLPPPLAAFGSVHRPGRRFVCELGDRIPDPAPDRYAVVIVGGCQLIGGAVDRRRPAGACRDLDRGRDARAGRTKRQATARRAPSPVRLAGQRPGRATASLVEGAGFEPPYRREKAYLDLLCDMGASQPASAQALETLEIKIDETRASTHSQSGARYSTAFTSSPVTRQSPLRLTTSSLAPKSCHCPPPE
jgi:hypothetical protein